MLGLLKRHEVQVLLKAGHKRTEVSRLTGISRSSVQRISAEATTEQFDDTAERLKRRSLRPSIVKGFWETINDILEKHPDLPSSHILRQVQNSGYIGGKTAFFWGRELRQTPGKPPATWHQFGTKTRRWSGYFWNGEVLVPMESQWVSIALLGL